jgi:hypothetical protein
VKELFPEAQVTIGPVIDNGFYYDFSFARLHARDLAAIETKMASFCKDEPVVREARKRDDAVKLSNRSASSVQGRDHRVDPRQRGHFTVPRRQFHRPVPRSACAVDRQAENLLDESRRRVLAA